MQNIAEILSQYGFTQEILLYLLYIPLIATVVNVARYIIGMKMYGIYAPLILAFAYIFTGIRFGLLITAAVIFSTLVSYQFLKKIRMHYLSRIAVNYVVISVFVVGVILINELSPISFTTSNHDIGSIPPLGIVLIASLSDFFIKQYVKTSIVTTLRSLVETVIIGFIGWTMFKVGWIQTVLLTQLWIYPLLIAVNMAVGQYSGLRLKDFSRFKRVVHNS